MNISINKLNTLTNNTEESTMNNSTNELDTLTIMNNNNELMALPKVSMMNLFDDIVVKEEIKSPQDWTLAECKKKLTVDQVTFRQSTKDNQIIVSVRFQGLTMLKISENKTTMTIPNGSFTKEEVLERIKSCDEMILEAKERHIASLKKAKTSRETTFKRKPEGEKPEFIGKEQHGQECSQPCCSE